MSRHVTASVQRHRTPSRSRSVSRGVFSVVFWSWVIDSMNINLYQHLQVGVPSLNPMGMVSFDTLKRNHVRHPIEGVGRWWCLKIVLLFLSPGFLGKRSNVDSYVFQWVAQPPSRSMFHDPWLAFKGSDWIMTWITCLVHAIWTKQNKQWHILYLLEITVMIVFWERAKHWTHNSLQKRKA